MKNLVTALAFILGLGVTSAFAENIDKRQVLMVSDAQREHVLEEMRSLLSGIQNILAALSRDDMVAVAQYARPLGMGMRAKVEDHLHGVLPKEFMHLGMSIHRDFDRIAADAESLRDPKHTLRQLSESMKKCVACHGSYQIRTKSLSLDGEERAEHHKH